MTSEERDSNNSEIETKIMRAAASTLLCDPSKVMVDENTMRVSGKDAADLMIQLEEEVDANLLGGGPRIVAGIPYSSWMRVLSMDEVDLNLSMIKKYINHVKGYTI